MQYSVYKITNLETAAIYIGYSKQPDKRWLQHKGASTSQKLRGDLYIDMAAIPITKRFKVFVFEVLSVHDTMIQALNEETRLIDEARKEGTRIYNKNRVDSFRVSLATVPPYCWTCGRDMKKPGYCYECRKYSDAKERCESFYNFIERD
jgi:predicted GIY-YIG superfamily endonuclease